MPLLCLHSTHHSRTSVLLRSQAQRFSDKLQRLLQSNLKGQLQERDEPIHPLEFVRQCLIQEGYQRPETCSPANPSTLFPSELQSTWYVRALKLKSITITAPCLVSIWVWRQQRSSPLLIRKIIKALDKAWQLTNTGQSTTGTTVPMGTGKCGAQENESCLN